MSSWLNGIILFVALIHPQECGQPPPPPITGTQLKIHKMVQLVYIACATQGPMFLKKYRPGHQAANPVNMMRGLQSSAGTPAKQIQH